MNEINAYGIAFIVGILLSTCWFATYLLGWYVQWLWSWIDDSKVGRVSAVNSYVFGKLFGYEESDSRAWNYKERCGLYYSDGIVAFFMVAFSLLFLPLLVVAASDFYHVTITVLVAAAVAWVARFSRRHKKLFDKHVNDKEAH